MAPIVPRWEWRTFGASVGLPATVLAPIYPYAVQESDELYLVPRRADGTVKLRAGLMDVKRLEEVDDHGLERWRPVLKTPFPLGADDVRVVMAALGVDAPDPARAIATFAGFQTLCDELGVRTVAVHKRRERYTVGGLAAELTDVSAEGAATRTFAIESTEPELIVRALDRLRFESLANTSYPRALRVLTGITGPRGAVIDIGTNSVKLHVGERRDGGWATVADRAIVTRLGEGLAAAGAITPAAMARTVDAVCELARMAHEAGAPIAAVGTAGLRIASNSADFVAAVHERCGVLVDVIPGDEESRLGYLAATASAGRRDGSVAVVETGGGSSQFTFGADDHIDERFSVDIGAVGLTERFGLDGPVAPAVVDQARTAVREGLIRLDGHARPDALFGIGGVFTNLAAIRHALAAYDPEVVEGTVLDRAEVDRQIEAFRTRSAEERRSITGLQPGRAEVILAGATIVRAVLDALGADSVTVSDRGLRHALTEERFGTSAV